MDLLRKLLQYSFTLTRVGDHPFGGLVAFDEENTLIEKPSGLKRLKTTWMNERWAPELLHYDESTVKEVTRLLVKQVRVWCCSGFSY